MHNEIIYHIDQDNLLVFFNDQWNIFANENDTPNLEREKVYKKSLWDFIHDAETRHFHEILLKRVRTNGAILNLPFRCDSPTLRRYMEMSISPRPDGEIEYRCCLIKAEEREPVLYKIANTNDEESFLRMCSWCNKIDVAEDDWVEIENAISRLNLFSDTSLPQVTHTMCGACMETFFNEDDK